MGIFDKFFRNKKIIEETVQDALDETKTKQKSEPVTEEAAVVKDEAESENEKLAERIRVVAKQYLPGDVASIYAQREMIKLLVKKLDIPQSAADDCEPVFNKLKKNEISAVQSSAIAANNVNNLIKDLDYGLLTEKLASNEDDALLKTWVVLDFYASTLKNGFSDNLKLLRNKLSAEIHNQGLDVEDKDEVVKLMTLEKECNELQKKKENAEQIKEKCTQLVKLVHEKKALYILFDELFNGGFPYISYDGRVEVCTRLETACALKNHYEKIGAGKTIVKRLEKNEYTKLFKAMIHMGIAFVRLDNGTFPVDIHTVELADGLIIANVIERFNSGMRGLFLRRIQYNHRLALSAEIIKGTPAEKTIIEAALSCRINGFREFGNSLIYVFVNQPYEKGTTLYTPHAFDTAKKLCAAVKLDDKALIAPGDTGFKVYEGGLKFRVTNKTADEPMDKSLICVFTSRLEAEKARLHFAEFGCNDSVVAVTYDELASQVPECAGVIVDMSSYGLEIKQKEFDEIRKFRSVKGRIAVNLKKKEEKANPSADEEKLVESEEKSEE